MNFLNFFSLVLLFVWQVSAGKCTGGRRNAKRFSSECGDRYQHNSSNDTSSNISKQPSDNPPINENDGLLQNNDTSKPNLSINTSPITSKQTKCKPPIKVNDVFYYSYDDKTKTLMVKGANPSTGISISLDDIQSNSSESSVVIIMVKNQFITYASANSNIYFSDCYQNIFNTLIIDFCHYSPFKPIEFIPTSLSNVKMLKIINCNRINTFGNLLDRFKDNLEELVIEECHFSTEFNVPSNVNLTKLQCARLIRCSLNTSILKNILALFPESLHILEISHLCINGENTKYVIFDNYLTLDFIDLKVHERFPSLKSLTSKGNNIKNFQFKNFKELEKIDATDNNNELFEPCDLETKLENFKNFKGIEGIESTEKLKEYYEDYFKDKQSAPINFKSYKEDYERLNDHHKLSTYTEVSFRPYFIAKDLNSITLERNRNFEHLKCLYLNTIHSPDAVVIMNRILNDFYGVRTISVQLPIEDITVEQIKESFEGITVYDKIENIQFQALLTCGTPRTCEFMIQVLKRVPNLKSLVFDHFNKFFHEDTHDFILMLYIRLVNEKLKFPNLKKIDIDTYNGSIELLLWFIQKSNITELNINNSILNCNSSQLLNDFSNNTLRTLRISGGVYTDNVDLLKKCFSNMKNLQELYILRNTGSIILFEANSIIEKVTIGKLNYAWFNYNVPFAVLKTFTNLKCICVGCKTYERPNVISAFEEHFEGRNVELIFTYECSNSQSKHEWLCGESVMNKW